MYSLTCILLIISLRSSLGIRKQPCSDYECTINAVITRAYPTFVAGIPGVESTDPLHLASIVIEQTDFKYTLLNASLTGLKDCEFKKLNYTFSGEITNFDYAMFCPEVTLTSDYEVKGIINSNSIEGKGSGTIIYDGLQISITGKQKKVKDDEGKLHINLVDYAITATAESARKPDYNNKLSNVISVANAIQLEKLTREATLDAFMKKFMSNYIKFHERVSVEDLHYKYVV